MYWALEIAEESKSSFGWLRNRLKIICYEDIGLANPDVVLQVSKAVDDMDFLYQNDNSEYKMVLAHIILLMCRSEKSRIVDHFKETSLGLWRELSIKNPEKFRLEIPYYALDMHTERGNKEFKRHRGSKIGIEHFIEEGERMENVKTISKDDYYRDNAHEYWRKAKKW